MRCDKLVTLDRSVIAGQLGGRPTRLALGTAHDFFRRVRLHPAVKAMASAARAPAQVWPHLSLVLSGVKPMLGEPLAGAAAAVARLNQALAGHPLQPAFLHCAGLEVVRQQAAVDGALIDPWHLAAPLEGLRLRMDPYLRIIDRGLIVDAACDLH